ncbi:21.7 kDa class VI heat shock protein [Abrus precatorius]|uniref:21.7 kDa class VI heat shock protein n=1 Tax=Abrus precatorius TaxID=3816 RepID=A0A8B8KHY8_ABRPR|nr:21.7 kDa class VI heat shock protein [Abrus precatorius]XP_027342535.1 21.7 kDa class VI heat shock protein [Abrus precatorius]
MTSSNKKLEVQTEDQTPHKWCVSLGEEIFKRFFSQTNPTVHKVFADGSLFSPMLFGKFFDPSDAFPLWEFESDVLLSHLKSSSQSTVDWHETDEGYILKAEIPGTGKNNIQVHVDKGKVVEISGQWKQQRDSSDWRCGHWWEYGYVRRLEMPEDADWKNIEAYIYNDIFLEIRIPKSQQACDLSQGKDVA